MNRATLSDAKYRDLFGDRDASAPEDDPEFMTILRPADLRRDLLHRRPR